MGSGGSGGGRFPGNGPGNRPGRRTRNRPNNNQRQNEQFRAVARELGLTKDQQRQFHNFISGQHDLGFRDLLQLARDFFDMN